MPEIIPAKKLKISPRALTKRESLLALSKERGRVVILGLNEWLKSHNQREKKMHSALSKGDSLSEKLGIKGDSLSEK